MAVPVYPVNLSIDYPDRELSRLTTFFRVFTVIPIVVILGLLTSGAPGRQQDGHVTYQIAAPGIVFLPTILMLLFRQKYPRWWFDWNVALTAFSYRVAAYLSFLRDEYPSTDAEQAVQLVAASRRLHRAAGDR
jgi:membrane protease YdiL (CAAX protease family)